jgi:transposase
VITERRQRRSYTAEEKARIVAESAAPGANISEVARRNGVNRGLLTVWRRGLSASRSLMTDALTIPLMYGPESLIDPT